MSSVIELKDRELEQLAARLITQSGYEIASEIGSKKPLPLEMRLRGKKVE